ncbi:hypothetical protein Micbo1qcDRAFT_166778 [Microdochium bolleyi]|uniref:ABM domain-containing protein n=1 Tax=Microdochium bolleyi TaxID=196109 RepID=A0A136IT34_9PEZI|nr:hypothetical protein Micbo1qcDRAFT_166778 [Microdochium bolleyi]
MTVTEIAHITLRSPSTEAFVAAATKSLPIQDSWFEARHGSTSPFRAVERGAAFFQQLEDPTKILITAHWAAVDEHKAWIASDENKIAFGALFHLIDLDQTDYFHVEDSAMFPVSILGADNTVVRITRFVVQQEDKAFWEERFCDYLTASGGSGGWRIEDDPEQPESTVQFVTVGPSRGQPGDAQENTRMMLSPGTDLEKKFLSISTRHYRQLF